MPVATFEAFKAELVALKEVVASYSKKTLRDDTLLDRFRTLYRTWISIVRPAIEPLLKSKKDFLKLGVELEALANLTSKYRPTADYRKRLNRTVELSNSLVLYLPFVGQSISSASTDLFLPSIPDLPSKLVPNALFGWRSKLEDFTSEYSFDKSVFIMVRYRKRNDALIKAIKSILSKNEHHGILASDHNLTDDLYNPIACLLCCSKGIAIFDKAESEEKFNPNVAYELGMLHLLGRSCLILKHQSLKTLQTDVLMKIYKEYKTKTQACSHTKDWISCTRS